MKILECLWLDQFVDKNIRKHHVYPEEVEQALFANPFVKKVENGDVKGEDLYVAFGRTQAGRYLSVLFVLKNERQALVISARDMTKSERKHYGKK